MRRYAEIGEAIVEALGRFAGDVRSGAFPSEAESYHLPEREVAALREALSRPEGPRFAADRRKA